MNKVDFIFRLAQAGYDQSQCRKIDEIIESYSERSFCCRQELYDAAEQYLICCRDIDKLKGFFLLSEEMNRLFPASWEASYQFVLKVVVGWC